MEGALVQHRSYLGDNRRLIIGRALAASAAGALPVPMLEDYLSSRVTRGTIRKIADSRSVDLTEAAVRALADGAARPPEWAEIAGGALAYKVFARSFRRMVLLYVAARRGQVAARTFLVGTLFDHYCARLHVGMGLDGPTAAELRAMIDQAIATTPGGLVRRMFREGVVNALRAGAAAPLKLANTLSGGRLRELLTQGDEEQAVAVVDDAIASDLGANKSLLSRSVAAVELTLAAEANPYLDQLIETFETIWRQRRASDEPSSPA